jgi:2-dehydro-3-deoxy-D-gluconate 5-dehydrogenase
MLDALTVEGRAALVTGGNGGLGKAIARGLIEAGALVAVAGRDRAKNRAVEAEFGERAVVLELDVTDETQVTSAVGKVIDRFGRLDILVNCAGSFRGGPVTELGLDAWREVLDTHLTGAFLCSVAAARRMIEAGRGGKIINIGSMYSIFGAPDFADYAAAKTGVLGLTRSLAVELGRHNIQVNAILPGWYETNLTSGMPETAVGEEIRRRTPAGRWGSPADLVGLTLLLSSPASDFITGACIPVDGGYSTADRLIHPPKESDA